ncbi:hypothetical protein NMY22_g8233 [Coprinellus aureogranulatus]|nr:hypothetical protein NMY22_g8233 [Coprinellus aureogranulatus]
MDYDAIDRLERDITAHVHAQLGEYSRKYYTVNYEDFTTEFVAEFIDELKCAPLTDPTALKLPEDPMRTLFRLKDIDALPPYEEQDRTTPAAIELLKTVQAQMRRVAPGRLRSERVVSEILESNISIPEPALPPDFMLTAKARRHRRVIGQGRYKKQVPTRFKALKSTHIPTELPHIEDVVEPALPVEELLKVDWGVKDIKDPLVHFSIRAASRLYKSVPNFDDRHYLDKFPLDLRLATDGPDAMFMPMFPRCHQIGYRCEATAGRKLSMGLGNLEEMTTVLPAGEPNPTASSDDLPTQNMRLVDGWQTICSSPPSSPDSPGVSDEEDLIDELCLPSTPNTDPPLVDDILRPKIEIPLFPRSRKRGGRAGVQKGALSKQKMATFLPPLLPSEVKPKEHALPTPSSPAPATSVLGQASLLDADTEPQPSDPLDVELEHLCKGVASDPLALIMDEKIDDKSVPLMEVPNLPEPTERNPSESTWIPKALQELVTPNVIEGEQLARPCVRKAPAKQSITLALSWALCETSEKPPPLIKVLDVESPLDSKDPEQHAAMLSDVEELLRKCYITEPEATTPISPFDARHLQTLAAPLPSEIKDPFKQPTLLLSRLDRQRLKGKRKSEEESEDEVEVIVLPQGERPADSQGSEADRRAKRTRVASREGEVAFVAPADEDETALSASRPSTLRVFRSRWITMGYTLKTGTLRMTSPYPKAPTPSRT